MSRNLHSHATKVIRHLIDPTWTVQSITPIDGGCVSVARRCQVVSRSGQVFFVFWKENEASFAENFQCEASGLDSLRIVGVIRTPEVLGHGTFDGRSHFVSQWIQRSPSVVNDAELGRRLAIHHRTSLRPSPGLDHDNFLGSNPQLNRWSGSGSVDEWTEFTRMNRFEPQIKMAKAGERLDHATDELLHQFIEKLPELLASRSDGYSLLHGDLWSGNLIFDQTTQPVWIDPSVWFGCREAEFGMILLFGNRSPAFFDAYQATYPMSKHWRRHAGVYTVYHLLNHVNLFGSGYLAPLRSSLMTLLGDGFIALQ